MKQLIREQAIKGDNKTLCFLRPMLQEDIPAAIRLLEDTYLTAENIESKLDNDGPASFQNSGGFLNRETPEGLAAKIADTESAMAVCTATDNKKVLAYIWLNSSKENKDFLKHSLLKNGSCDREKLFLFEKEDAVEFMDFILSREDAGLAFHAMDILDVIFRWLQEEKIGHVFFQIYSILGEWTLDGYKHHNCENFASTRLMGKMECKYAGFYRLPAKDIGNRRFDAIARIYELDLRGKRF